MTTTPTQQDKTDKPASAPLTRWQPVAWVMLVVIVAAVLAADLGLKYWAFENVAEDMPVRLTTLDNGDPLVTIPEPDGTYKPAYQRTATRPPLTREPEHVPAHEPIVVVPKLLNFQLTLNTGAVFGTGKGGRPIFITVSVLAVAVIVVLVYRAPRGSWAYQVGLAMILGGALGNLYDRVYYSAVRDMLHMLPTTGLWPWIFNIADVALIAGVALVLLVSWTAEYKRAKLAKQQGAQVDKPDKQDKPAEQAKSDSAGA